MVNNREEFQMMITNLQDRELTKEVDALHTSNQRETQIKSETTSIYI